MDVTCPNDIISAHFLAFSLKLQAIDYISMHFTGKPFQTLELLLKVNKEIYQPIIQSERILAHWKTPVTRLVSDKDKEHNIVLIISRRCLQIYLMRSRYKPVTTYDRLNLDIILLIASFCWSTKCIGTKVFWHSVKLICDDSSFRRAALYTILFKY